MSRLAGLHPEDFVLAGWNAAGVPWIIGAGGALAPILALGNEPNALAGTVQLIAVVGAIVAIATRPPSGSPASILPRGEVRAAFIGPMGGAFMFVAGSVSAYLGLGLEGLIVALAFVVVTAALMLGDHLPVIDATLRRALIMPFILVCGGIFNGFSADLLRGLDIGSLMASLTVDQTGFGAFLILMVVAGVGVYYAMLVVAPRILVSPEQEHGCVVWPMRFVLYLVSAIFGIGWLAML